MLNNEYQAEGVRGNFMLQITLTISDIRQGAGSPTGPLNYRAYAIFIESGILTVNDMLYKMSSAGLTEEMIKAAPEPISGYARQHANYTGAGFFHDMWKGIKKAYNVARPVAREVADVIANVAPYIPHPAGSAVGSVARLASKAMGGKKKGGRRARAQSLSRRL